MAGNHVIDIGSDGAGRAHVFCDLLRGVCEVDDFNRSGYKAITIPKYVCLEHASGILQKSTATAIMILMW